MKAPRELALLSHFQKPHRSPVWVHLASQIARTLYLALALSLTYYPLARADNVVKDGRFTNIYVYPNPSKETWDEHFKNLPATQKPTDWNRFTRKSIDDFTETLMSPQWPSYFGALHQYGGINPPRFFGSANVSQPCVDAAMKDLHNGVLEWTTIRSLANCHQDGLDPSPQVNLIFSPDISIGPAPSAPSATANGPDMCVQTGKNKSAAYHYWGINTPNFAVLPTASACAPSFNIFTESMSHEIIEMLSDPAQSGHGAWGGSELGDQCPSIDVTWQGYNVQRYRSDNDNLCWPLPLPVGSTATTWVLAQGSPSVRFTGDIHEFTFAVPNSRLITDARATDVQIWIQTGGDNLRGGDDNADVMLSFVGGNATTNNINGGKEWGNGQTHSVSLNLPPVAPRVQDIQNITLRTRFTGGTGGENWNVDKAALVLAFPLGSATSVPASTVTHTWLDISAAPIIRFSGDMHDLTLPLAAQDAGQKVSAIDVIISTGNDDLRGGSHANDNCDLTLTLVNGATITMTNLNGAGTWENWTDHTVHIPLPISGLRGGDIQGINLHTGFGGGVDGDNWNVQRVQLLATVNPPEAHIVSPHKDTNIGLGGVGLQFQGKATNFNDPNPSMKWTSDKEGPIGQGPSINHVFNVAGKQTILLTAKDSKGLTATDSIVIDVTNAPPMVKILKPTSGQTLYQNFAYTFDASAFDQNETAFTLPCTSLKWSSSNPADPLPMTGCAPAVKFAALGARTLTLTGTDSGKATGTASVVITVGKIPAHSPPMVRILNPLSEHNIDPNATVQFRGTAIDPDGKNPIAYKWVLQMGNTQIPLGNGAAINSPRLIKQINASWKPSTNTPFKCGGYKVRLYLYATDPDGQIGSDYVDIYLAYPVC